MNDRPKLYLVPMLFQQVEEAIENHLETGEPLDETPGNALLSMGPDLIDQYSLFVDERWDAAKACREQAKKFTERARRLETGAEKMEDYFKAVLMAHFDGKVKTALGTYSVRKVVSYDYTTTPEAHPEFFKVEFTIKKKELNDLQKAGTLPKDIEVQEKTTESLAVRQ